ncbi:MAG: archease [Candidatus Aminicenantaceae bacterium]
MQKFRFLEHTADAKFQAFGDSLEESFFNAALAVSSLMWDIEKVEANQTKKVYLKAKDLFQLLCSFLEEIIYLWETKGFILKSPDNIKIKKNAGEFTLTSDFKGDKYSDKYNVYGEVKAITYNEMKIESNEHFMVQVVVDI